MILYQKREKKYILFPFYNTLLNFIFYLRSIILFESTSLLFTINE